MSMKRIERLAPRVAEQIAAGEVIERPASVIKELLENALDAGATEVAVTLRDGGKTLIEVLDNGSGIHSQDLPLALERHATSKLKAIEDLESLLTLGFRGEALASIGAVSQLEVLSRAKEQDVAHVIRLNHSTRELAQAQAQPITFGHFLGSSHGTRIRSEGLFSQIPARLKFLKSPASELSLIREWIERLSLTHPEVGFRLQNEDRLVLQLRPQSEEERIRRVVADDQDFPIRKIETQGESGLRLKLFWIQGMSLPHTKSLIQIVNGRILRDRVLQQALMQPFRQSLLPGKFPALVAFLELDPGEMDVNVHPTKSEIRFLDSRKIFTAFDQAIGMLIRTHGVVAHVGGTAISPGADDLPHFSREPAKPSWATARTPLAFDFTPGAALVSDRTSSVSEDSRFSPALNPTFVGNQEFKHSDQLDTLHAPASPDSRPGAHPVFSKFRPENFLGDLFRTFLAYDLGDELGLIDQHAAHERIRFELLKKRAIQRAQNQDVQDLLIPEAVRFDPEAVEKLQSRLSLLSRLGFEAEIFGPGQLLVRSIPPEWGNLDLRTRLKNLVERLLALDGANAQSEELFLDERLFEKLASEACRSSVRAGDRIDAEAAAALIDQLSHCEHPWNCPHGRPTLARVPRSRFEEWFQRIV